jgi:hypothetical protein
LGKRVHHGIGRDEGNQITGLSSFRIAVVNDPLSL